MVLKYDKLHVNKLHYQKWTLILGLNIIVFIQAEYDKSTSTMLIGVHVSPHITYNVR